MIAAFCFSIRFIRPIGRYIRIILLFFRLSSLSSDTLCFFLLSLHPCNLRRSCQPLLFGLSLGSNTLLFGLSSLGSNTLCVFLLSLHPCNFRRSCLRYTLCVFLLSLHPCNLRRSCLRRSCLRCQPILFGLSLGSDTLFFCYTLIFFIVFVIVAFFFFFIVFVIVAFFFFFIVFVIVAFSVLGTAVALCDNLCESCDSCGDIDFIVYI